MANKVKFGLRNVYYSVIASDGTYGTPVAINGAVNLSLDTVGDKEDFYADDTIYYSSTANQGYEGDLEIALIPDSFKTDVLGMTADSNGALIENADDVIKSIALGFEVQGDDKPRRTWLYNCQVARPADNSATIEASKTPNTETLTISVMPRSSDRAVKCVMTKTNANEADFNTFFNDVYEAVGSH